MRYHSRSRRSECEIRFRKNRLLEEGTRTYSALEFYNHYNSPVLRPWYIGENKSKVPKGQIPPKELSVELYIKFEAVSNIL